MRCEETRRDERTSLITLKDDLKDNIKDNSKRTNGFSSPTGWLVDYLPSNENSIGKSNADTEQIKENDIFGDKTQASIVGFYSSAKDLEDKDKHNVIGLIRS